ncbi:NK-tumor recognition protein-like [Homarus americanus]|uniref:NK-tumor recognition protein-like n=1 Tax=Homarus americanus TaxID=6706 RepID=UPI001C483CAC|nr:NK-tumor recognition protein-like [Homarus americanus]XP_042230574.1 NK-tumor recognition protein-like [Homarus americanus]
MAFDSDVEAYLNQLSKKTYSLKQDAQTSGHSFSRRTSTADKCSDSELNLSDENGSPIRTDKLSSLTQRKEVGSVSDITALSEKYRESRHKKPHSHDKLSSLEQKYLKKHKSIKDIIVSESSDDPDYNKASLQKSADLKLKNKSNSIKKTPNSTMQQKSIDFRHDNVSRTHLMSPDSSVDEELAQYLKETSLTDNQNDGFLKGSAVTRSYSVTEDSDGSMDEVIKLDNILTVDDILGQMTDDESKAAPKHAINKCESDHSSESQISTLTDNLKTVHDNVYPTHKGNNNMKNKSAVSGSTAIKDKSSLNTLNNDKEGSLLVKSTEGCFYSKSHHVDKDFSKPVGMLLAQTSNDVFHSTRRKSLIEFNTEGIVKPILSKSSIKNTNKKVKPKLYSEDSVVESIASSIESSLATSVVEENSSVCASVGQSVEENLVKEAFDSPVERPPTDASENSSETDESISLKMASQNTSTRKNSQDKILEVKNPTKHSTRKHKELDLSCKSNSQKQTIISDQEESMGNRKLSRKSKKTKKYSQKQSKSKKKHRSSSSESPSSSETVSDSQVERHHRHYSRSHRHKWNSDFNPWFGPPYIQPWPPHYHQHTYPTPAGIYNHYPSPTLVEGLLGQGGVGVKELMHQQVALTRQFLDSQRALYHAYTATLTSSHHYTSLNNTEKYIKKRKPPLTFSEAYKIVQEEMKASE